MSTTRTEEAVPKAKSRGFLSKFLKDSNGGESSKGKDGKHGDASKSKGTTSDGALENKPSKTVDASRAKDKKHSSSSKKKEKESKPPVYEIWVAAFPVPGFDYTDNEMVQGRRDIGAAKSIFEWGFWFQIKGAPAPRPKRYLSPDWGRGWGIELLPPTVYDPVTKSSRSEYAISDIDLENAVKARVWREQILGMAKVGEIQYPANPSHLQSTISNPDAVAFPRKNENNADWARRALVELKRQRLILQNVQTRFREKDGTGDVDRFMDWFVECAISFKKSVPVPDNVCRNWWDWYHTTRPFKEDS